MSIISIKEFALYKYANSMHTLYYELETFLKNYFGDSPIKFNDNERIVFNQPDLDFYISNEFPGFSLYNLQLILRELDIPNYFCLLVSNMPNIQKYTKMAQNILTTDPVPITSITSLYDCICENPVYNRPAFDYSNIISPFIVLIRQKRFHRTYFMSQLFERQLQYSGLIAYNNINIPSNDCSNDQIKTNNCAFLTTTPFVLSNNELRIKSKQNRTIVEHFQNKVSSFKNFNEDFDVSNKNAAISFNQNIIGRSLIYVGVETVVNYPDVFLSTISFKGITSKRPFVILGVPGTIAYLKSLGFKTFSDFWDEDYDLTSDFESRCNKILTILESFKGYSDFQLQTLIKKINHITEYNFLYYTTTFVHQEKNKLQGIRP